MFTREKIIIRFNLFFRNLLFHFVFWYAGLLLYVFLTGNDQLFSKYVDIIEFNSWYLTNFFLAASIALLFTLVDTFFNDRFMRFSSSRILVFLPSLFYFAIGFLLMVLAPLSPKTLLNVKGFDDVLALMPEMNIHFTRFLVYFYLACFFNNFLQRMVKKVGKGNFKNWVFGILNKPREEERIFMFIDMRSSTSIAEKLSHKKFSHLVQDVFNDMAVVDNYMGEIYQYLGDGAIISWPVERGLKNNNCLRAFYGFVNVVNKRERYYERRYGLVPKFKAGIHVGKVMVLQVGRIRRDISYNGDTLNTAARIESMCNIHKKSLLVSSDLVDMMVDRNGFYVREVGNIKLKGKRRKVDLHYVREKRAPVQQTSPQIRTLLEKLNIHKNKLVVTK